MLTVRICLVHNVLVVDDDQITLELLQLILEEFIEGKITTLSSGTQAIEYICSDKISDINLVICDWQMPEKDGIEVLKTLRKRAPNLPFLMLTGNATRDLVITARKEGATDFVAKPFKNYDLTEKVNNLLS
ncbi:response regulator [Aliiglaciecola sp. M165]|nr:response regulator [Aliiglaciecola sp. M165]